MLINDSNILLICYIENIYQCVRKASGFDVACVISQYLDCHMKIAIQFILKDYFVLNLRRRHLQINEILKNNRKFFVML